MSGKFVMINFSFFLFLPYFSMSQKSFSLASLGVQVFSKYFTINISMVCVLLSALMLITLYGNTFSVNIKCAGRQVPIFSYYFLFFSAYSYFSYFLAISSYFSYFLAILLIVLILFAQYLFPCKSNLLYMAYGG